MVDKEELGASLFSRTLDIMENDPLEEIFALNMGDFVSEFLLVNKDNKVMENLPSPGEGTLANRLLPIKNNLKAKTGTLSDISSIAGYLTTRSGKNLVFCIMLNDMKLSASDKKMLEDYILREAYLSL